MDKLNLLAKLKVIVKSYPEEWDDVDLVDDPEEFFDFIQRFGGPAKIDKLHGDEKWVLYDLAKYNYDRLTDGSLNKENVVVPEEKTYTVNWTRNTTEYRRDYGEEKYIGADKESIDKRVNFEVENRFLIWVKGDGTYSLHDTEDLTRTIKKQLDYDSW